MIEREIESINNRNNHISFITYKNLSTNEIKRIELVKFIRSDPLENIVSLSSPLGSSLYEKKVDEIVTVVTENSRYQIRIINIELIN